MASGFVAVVALRHDSHFTPFTPGVDDLSTYDEQALMFIDNKVASEQELLMAFLEETFESGNIGALRERLTRSLSVGDVIVLEHVRTGRKFVAAIEPNGWKHYIKA